MKPKKLKQTYLIHYGEIGLKGKNRKDFEFQLKRNIKNRMKHREGEPNIEIKNKYLTLEIESTSQKETIPQILKTTFGIKWFAAVEALPRKSDLDTISKIITSRAHAKADSKRTFKISCKRADKTYTPKSAEIERQIGANIIAKTDYKKVDLTNPDDTYSLEINPTEIFVYDTKTPGPGGLPVGSNGRVLVLLSGGIDSPVAAHMMAKRGCSIDFLHFYVNEPGDDSKIMKLAKEMTKFTGKSRMYLAPYLHFNLGITEIDTEYELVLFRRFMLRIAEKLCMDNKIDAIATGDNLGQVASQTIENLNATNDALENTVCFRPLIGMDKEEIISLSKRIGTYITSIQPGKDCCSIIDRHARTKVSISKIIEEEGKFHSYDKIIQDTLNDTTPKVISPN